MSRSVASVDVNTEELERVDLGVRPGLVMSRTVLQLHTEPAKKLVLGRRREDGEGIVGLLSFAKAVGRIVAAAKAGDVFARWYLVRIEQRIREGEERIQALETALSEKVKKGVGIDVDVGASKEPLSVNLSFGNPYGYRGADLVAEFDEVARMIVVGQRIGRLVNTERRLWLVQGGNAVRRVFQLGVEWKDLGDVVQAVDVENHTPLAQQAETQMGIIPAEVARGEWLPELVELSR